MYNMPSGYYINKQNKENDKYEGLLSPKQKRDLDGGISVQSTKISHKKLTKKVLDTKFNGINYNSPFNPD